MGDQDLFYPNPTIPDGMHDWTLSAALMAKVLAAKGYHYQYLFVRNAKHVDRPTSRANPAIRAGVVVEGLSDSLRGFSDKSSLSSPAKAGDPVFQRRQR